MLCCLCIATLLLMCVLICMINWWSLTIEPLIFHCTGAVTLTQTHPDAPYVCRTGNITLRCQYDTGVVVSWSVGNMSNVNIFTIPGHTALPPTTTYQEVVVDSYTNLSERYQCAVVGMSYVINSNNFMPPQPEGKLCRNTVMLCMFNHPCGIDLQCWVVWLLPSVSLSICIVSLSSVALGLTAVPWLLDVHWITTKHQHSVVLPGYDQHFLYTKKFLPLVVLPGIHHSCV